MLDIVPGREAEFEIAFTMAQMIVATTTDSSRDSCRRFPEPFRTDEHFRPAAAGRA